MFRHICIIILITLTCGYASAQADTHMRQELPMFDSSRPQHIVEVNPHIGIGLSSLIQNYSSAIPGLSDLQLSPGCKMSAGVNVRFALRSSFALGTGIDFTISNSNYAMSLVDENSGSISSIYMRNHFYEITVPVFISARLNIGRFVRWNIDGGIYLSQGCGGSMKASGYTSGENSLGQPVVSHSSYRTDYFKDEESLINGVRSFDYGPHIATGLTFRRRFSLNMVLNISARNLAINYGNMPISYRNISLVFQLGYNI